MNHRPAMILASTSSRRFLSSEACDLSVLHHSIDIASLSRRGLIRSGCSLLVALSFADTLTMPLASISKVTSICGTARCARDPDEIEPAKQLIVRRHFAFALKTRGIVTAV
jgi:hypothetical protein